jgi:hypothetical protein
MAKCTCGKCAACKARKSHADEHGKYTEKQDKTKDARMTKGLTPAEKRKFEAEDKKHADKKKPKTMEEDKTADAKIIRKIKSNRKGKK